MGLTTAERPYRRVAFLTDMHYPFQCPRAIDAAFDFLQDWRPDLLILGGDQVDCYAISDYDKDPAREARLQDECDSVRPLWAACEALHCDVLAFEGNHEERLTRRKNKAGLADVRGLDMPTLTGMPAHFRWAPSQSHYRVGGPDWGLVFLHGDLKGRGCSAANPAGAMLKKLRGSSISGHIHRFDAAFSGTYSGRPLEAFTVGHMGDVTKAADYITSPDWQQGFATVEFDHDAEWFGVHLHRVVSGRFRYAGKTYGR